MLELANTVLAVVDVQGKLAQLMSHKESLFRNLQILVRAAQVFGLPVLWCEQNPAGLGSTIPEIAGLLKGQAPIEKMTFSCYGEPKFISALEQTGRRQVLLAGIEAHVCVYLTAAELVQNGYRVEIVADAVSSRDTENKRIGIEKAVALGAGLTCTETALFELLRTASAPQFREIVRLVK
jgi:nicotinamidase-related amidase